MYELGDKAYYPDGADKVSDKRLFGVHTPESLTQENGVVRIVFATIVMGMGVDMKATSTIIHYGAPQSIEDYFQESGRGGRSGSPANWQPKHYPARRELATSSTLCLSERVECT